MAAMASRNGVVAVALAAALWHHEDSRDVIVVCSGGNVDADVFRGALERFA